MKGDFNMKKAERIATAKEMYINAILEKRLAENAYRDFINGDNADNFNRRMYFREDWKEKRIYAETLYKVFVKFDIVPRKELEEIEMSL